ncbi:helix-turn-helix transcriptional regulator [Streptomyces sp. SHP 1-2]|uniref:helix-turn-helix transcriptional regulator n=1 Tax=Streptomyces sp. SHP 1-2 TaxID=2769489 RepID=UPI00223732AA|nr:LuxR family transcriptional regulator [Streptomyces sp. SHP 1-2]MCW5252482.1 AAA family ATPase [Streptomyces sp. SHP 1-2]
MLVTSPVVVGRAEQLGLLDAGLAAVGAGRGRAVFLLGEAGIGKSRLAGECAYRAVTGGLAVLRGRSGPGAGAAAPFRPIAEALLSLFRVSGPPRAPELVPYRSALAGILPEWRAGGTPAEPTSLIETAEAVLRVLLAVARDRESHPRPGCLLILEDLHDADAETLAVVEYLCGNLADLPVFLLGTLRSEAGAAGTLVREAARSRCADLTELLPLSAEQVTAMAGAALAADAARPLPGADPPPLPGPVAERLARDAEGNPFVVEELLSGMITAGVLRRGLAGDWEVCGDLGIDVPRTVVHSVIRRADRLSPAGRTLLDTAAVLGRRFPLSVLQRITGLGDRDLLVHLRAGIDAQLISSSGPVADWYEFRHALTAEALLSGLLPTERAALARRAADAIEQAHPGLPGEWCPRVAGLRLTAGDPAAAARRYAEAGEAARREGAVDSAVSFLERAQELLPATERAPVVEQLLYTLMESGRLDRALALVDTLPVTGPGALDTARAAALRARLAWATVTAARYADAAAQAHHARRLFARLGDGPAPAVDVVEAHLALADTGPSGEPGAGGAGTDAGAAGTEAGADRADRAERLARRAAEEAERTGLPEVACQAWQLLAMLERRHGFDRADACLERGLALATEHGLTTLQIDALLRLGSNDFMRGGSSALLERAHRAAVDHGALVLMHNAEASLAMQAVLTGRYAAARELADRCVLATARLRNTDNHQFVLLTRATLAAHRGNRREMERELAEFRRWDGDTSLQLPVLFGSRAVCALLEEDHEQALRELDQSLVWEKRHPSVFYLNGRYGLRPLLRALTGRADPAEHAAVAAHPAAALPWNRQFERFALAVHEGRAGHALRAGGAVEQAVRAGGPFPMGRRIGLRLVAQAALADGWGDPVAWAREAEEYFHEASVPAVAGACRELLRRAGATVRQRRRGASGIPAALRRIGLTPREYEVFLLLVPRLGNKDIAERLYISARTVEKHVASLLAKTGSPHRSALCDYAAEATGPAGPG